MVFQKGEEEVFEEGRFVGLEFLVVLRLVEEVDEISRLVGKAVDFERFQVESWCCFEETNWDRGCGMGS